MTLEALITQLSAAKPQSPVYAQPTRAAGTPGEVAAAFNELHRAFAFNRT